MFNVKVHRQTHSGTAGGVMITVIRVLLVICLLGCTGADIDPFADSIPFAIKWNPAPEEANVDDDAIVVPMITKNKEKYECRFHQEQGSSHQSPTINTYDGPSIEEILEDFAKTTACSYRVESFWTYELCHGKHLRQYHEERDPNAEDGKVLIHPEFFLGNYVKDQSLEVGEDLPTLIFDKVKYPYMAVKYDQGTVCDLTNTPRLTTVQYICHEKGRGDLYQIKETSTCEYTAVVLVEELCKHPQFQAAKETSRPITCYALEGAPTKPQLMGDIDKELALRTEKTESVGQAAAPPVTKEQQEATRTDIGKSEDELFLQNFLSGQMCLQGGSGWWNYELCHGETAKQFHMEGGKRVTTILLGKWDVEEHLKWLDVYPTKNIKRKSARKYISHFYSKGDFCDEINAQRTVEVKLKCMTTKSGSSHAVAIYLLEPSTCRYVLTVESPILCEVIERADDRGLIP